MERELREKLQEVLNHIKATQKLMAETGTQIGVEVHTTKTDQQVIKTKMELMVPMVFKGQMFQTPGVDYELDGSGIRLKFPSTGNETWVIVDFWAQVRMIMALMGGIPLEDQSG